MTPLAMVWTDIRILVLDTTRIWWRMLPKIVAIFLFGWLGYQLALKLAIPAGHINPWLGLLIFAFSFVSKLAAVVLILRLVGNALGVRRLIPRQELEEDDRDTSVTGLLAMTLLPFLGIYTAYGLVTKASDQMIIEDWFRSGGAFAEDTIIGGLRLNGDDVPVSRYIVVLSIIVGAYLVRRLVDALQERTGWRPLGIVGTFIESFFVLVTITAGVDIMSQIKFWVADRAIFGWLETFKNVVADAVAALGINLPAVLSAVWSFITEHAWPVITSGLAEPIFWLAIAALIYGSSVISIGELWRAGKPLASRVRVARRVLERAARQTEEDRAARAGKAVMSQVKEAFLGDIDDKYLPTLHSLRLILRAGFSFLGAYVVVYGAQKIATSAFDWLLANTIGGHQFTFWLVWLPSYNLVIDLIFEPWRLCLLAAALRRCLIIFRTRAEVRGTLDADQHNSAEQVAAEELIEPASGRQAVGAVG
ncbi:hypothetical protein [Microlunatus soli]|uniref:Uncharacterized protein n=1 Tax=Microlunatus soli TaxID=630515 RepID=A0A1H1UIV2_9ACTN|nr:hypothetical protein [Microlunatus soli]SDS72280.1 hypothetical protein SAMN04489812_2804 [Microlunatus soli]